MRCSRCRAASAWARVRTVSPLITKPTASITRKVSTWRASLTAKVMKGGTKKKSKAATLRMEASSEGPRPERMATAMIPSR